MIEFIMNMTFPKVYLQWEHISAYRLNEFSHHSNKSEMNIENVVFFLANQANYKNETTNRES